MKKKISAFTCGPCNFPLVIGEKFSMFDGNVQGYQVKLEKYSKIEQKWRFNSWPENHFSVVILEFKDEGGSTELLLTQSGVPSNDFERTRSGWEEFFWNRIRCIFMWNYTIKK